MNPPIFSSGSAWAWAWPKAASSTAASAHTARLLAAVLLAAALLGWVRPAWGQAPPAITATAEIPIVQNNLELAHREALRQAQLEGLTQAVAQLLAPEWQELYADRLKTNIYDQVETFVSSFKVLKEEPSEDKTLYRMDMEVSVSMELLVEALKGLSLPIYHERVRPVWLFYPANDPVLSNPDRRQGVVERLNQRLELLNMVITESSPLEPSEADTLADPYKNTKANKELLKAKTRATAEALFLAFQQASGGFGKTPPASQAVFFHVMSGAPLARFEQASQASLPPLEASQPLPTPWLEELLTPLTHQMQPDRIQEAALSQEAQERTHLVVKGLTSIYGQERFEQDVLRKSAPLKGFFLASMSRDTVTYEGETSANMEAVLGEMKEQKLGDFVVLNTHWEDQVATLTVKRESQPVATPLIPFPETARPRLAQQAISRFLEQPGRESLEPKLAEKEDNGYFDRTNLLALESPIYGYLDARSDADFYQAQGVAPGQTFRLTWVRMDQTNLDPAIRLYDQEGNLIKTAFPTRLVELEYTVPEGQNSFYIEVGDRYGFLKFDVGGYRSCHYLLVAKKR